jgi:hypothetical protein
MSPEKYCFCLCRLSVRPVVHPSALSLSGLHRSNSLMGFQPNFTGVISIIPSCARHWHAQNGRGENRKILSGFHRSNYWYDFNHSSQEWSVLSLVLSIIGMFCFAAQNGCQSLKIKKFCPAITCQTEQSSQEWSEPWQKALLVFSGPLSSLSKLLS